MDTELEIIEVKKKFKKKEKVSLLKFARETLVIIQVRTTLKTLASIYTILVYTTIK